MVKICVAGATGRMGSTILKEALSRGFEIVGAVSSPNNPNIGKSLREAGICDMDVEIKDPSRLEDAVRDADVYISFTTPEAEVKNIPVVAEIGRKIVMGTTGLTREQMNKIKIAVVKKVPAVFSPNFSLGVNVLLKVVNMLHVFPEDYQFSIVEIHHIGKRDSPSGTAKRIGELVSKIRGYSKIIYGREGVSPRSPEELEILSVRAGGVPGIHDLIIAGPHEMITIRHTAFSRSVFAQGALYAAEWISHKEEPGIYTMEDVLGL